MGSWLDKYIEADNNKKHSWELSEEDKAKMERRRKINYLKIKGIEVLKEQWLQEEPEELIKLAREIGKVLNEERDNGEKIDLTLLGFLGELHKILKVKDTSGPEIELNPWSGENTEEIQQDEEARMKRLKELERIEQYIKRMQDYLNKQNGIDINDEVDYDDTIDMNDVNMNDEIDYDDTIDMNEIEYEDDNGMTM